MLKFFFLQLNLFLRTISFFQTLFLVPLNSLILTFCTSLNLAQKHDVEVEAEGTLTEIPAEPSGLSEPTRCENTLGPGQEAYYECACVRVRTLRTFFRGEKKKIGIVS